MITHDPKFFDTKEEAVLYRDGLFASKASGEFEIKQHGEQWMVKVWQEGEEIIEPTPAKEEKKKVRRFK